MNLNHIHTYHSEDLAIRASVVITTELVREIQKIQNSFPIATIAMGRLVTGALLMASGLAEKQQVSIRVHGDGPLGELSSDASFESECRVYCAHPQTVVAPIAGRLPVGKAIGKGLLTITRFHEFHKHPQVSVVEIQSGEIAEDLSYYYQQSHQVPSFVALSVSMDKNGTITAAGGIILELMPGAPSTLISRLENRAKSGRPLSELISGGANPLDLIKEYSHSDKLKENIHPYPVKYSCPCTLGRVERTLKLLGKASLAEMILNGKPCEVKCQFCGRGYSVELETLRRLHDDLVTN